MTLKRLSLAFVTLQCAAFRELLVFPFLWQQVEYVMGGGSSHYMFLVLAAKDLLKN